MTNPSKQGLKLSEKKAREIITKVEMTNPSKQGLKHSSKFQLLQNSCRNDKSIKTRIETNCTQRYNIMFNSRNDKSIKTRIETKRDLIGHRDGHWGRNDKSIKTRIETDSTRSRPPDQSVEMTNPSKQGLKQIIVMSFVWLKKSKWQIHQNKDWNITLLLKVGKHHRRNDKSIKTRIETQRN